MAAAPAAARTHRTTNGKRFPECRFPFTDAICNRDGHRCHNDAGRLATLIGSIRGHGPRQVPTCLVYENKRWRCARATVAALVTALQWAQVALLACTDLKHR